MLTERVKVTLTRTTCGNNPPRSDRRKSRKFQLKVLAGMTNHRACCKLEKKMANKKKMKKEEEKKKEGHKG